MGFVVAALALLILGVLVVGVREPRADRDWAADHAEPARIVFASDGAVTIHGLRDFRHRAAGAFDERYRDLTFRPEDVRRVWFALAPFAERWRGLAHTFLSFELTDGRFVAVSVEARRQADERYSLVGGLLRGFELTYVVGTEEDLVGLRALRGDTLYLYPARAGPAQASELFLDVLRRAERTRAEPEFYHTLLNNCATNLRDHVNRLAADPLPYGWGLVFPGYSDRLALEHGLLDTDVGIDEARRRFRVDAAAREALAAGGRDFSLRIRAASGAPPGHGSAAPGA